MTKIHLVSKYAEKVHGNTQIHMTEAGPMATQTVEVKNTEEAMEKLEAYRQEVGKLGKGAVVYAMLGRGERSPKGFKARTEKWPEVNL